MPHQVPDMPGVKADGHLAHKFRYEVAGLLNRDQITFPGAQPVSFSNRHLQELREKDYYVCEKSDGIRCLMYLTKGTEGEEVVYLIDRKNDYYWVPNLHFPLEGSNQDNHTQTIVDGELVIDTQANGQPVMRYLVYDCLVLDGLSLMPRTLDIRLGYYREKVYNPYRQLYKEFPEEIQYLPFQLEFKEMQVGYGIEMMFKDVLPNLQHGNDGLIFTCRTTPYQFGTDQHILKWKSADLNSIDFRMQLQFPLLDDSDLEEFEGEGPWPDYDAVPQINLMAHENGDRYIPYGQLGLDKIQWGSMKGLDEPLNDRIAECCLDRSKVWRFMRFRDDKKDANHISVVESVMESINDAVSRETLIAASKGIKAGWRERQALQEAKAVAQRKAASAREANGSSAAKRKFEEGSDV